MAARQRYLTPLLLLQQLLTVSAFLLAPSQRPHLISSSRTAARSSLSGGCFANTPVHSARSNIAVMMALPKDLPKGLSTTAAPAAASAAAVVAVLLNRPRGAIAFAVLAVAGIATNVLNKRSQTAPVVEKEPVAEPESTPPVDTAEPVSETEDKNTAMTGGEAIWTAQALERVLTEPEIKVRYPPEAEFWNSDVRPSLDSFIFDDRRQGPLHSRWMQCVTVELVNGTVLSPISNAFVHGLPAAWRSR
eukprot:5038890-Pleurochrysis_carterae.AAC.1